jgi:hypothetical protein
MTCSSTSCITLSLLVDRFFPNFLSSKAIITTSKTGYLAKSRAFEDTVWEQQYLVQPTNDEIDFFGNLLPDQVEATITTDGGGELSKSHEMTRLCNSHGYKMHSKAANSSSQNGIVEHPHRTLKERMRCMLYSLRLGHGVLGGRTTPYNMAI